MHFTAQGNQEVLDCSSCRTPYCKHKKKKKAVCTCGSKESVKCVCHSKNWQRFKLTDDCPCRTRQTQTPPTLGMYPEEPLGVIPGMTGIPETFPPNFVPGYQHPPGVGFPSGYIPAGYTSRTQRPETTETSSQCPICEEIEANNRAKNNKCSCGTKNHTCECPSYELEEPLPDFYIEINHKEANRLRSDMTQTTSGFNVKFKKRPIEVDMSFEDALNYYEDLETTHSGYTDPDLCDCDEKGRKKKKKKKNVKCECPYEPLPSPLHPLYQQPGTPSEPELKGFKVSVGGKGSASTGLQGVCCFDLITDN